MFPRSKILKTNLINLTNLCDHTSFIQYCHPRLSQPNASVVFCLLHCDRPFNRLFTRLYLPQETAYKRQFPCFCTLFPPTRDRRCLIQLKFISISQTTCHTKLSLHGSNNPSEPLRAFRGLEHGQQCQQKVVTRSIRRTRVFRLTIRFHLW